MIEVDCSCTELTVGLNPIFNSGNGVGVTLVPSHSTDSSSSSACNNGNYNLSII